VRAVDHRFALSMRPCKRAFQKIILQRQLSNLRMERFQIHSWSMERPWPRTQILRQPLQKLCFPLRDLVDVHVELLRQLDQRLLALRAANATFALNAGLWFRRTRFVIVSPDSAATMAAVRQKFHLARRSNLPSHLCLSPTERRYR